jgi:RNA polymerase sigma-70 factor (ECF subfamily)
MAALFERFRPYLLLIAEQELDSALRPKMGASDLVQQTLWKAWRGRAEFRGADEAALRAWLRQILLNSLADEVQRYSVEKRQLSRELRIDDDSRFPGGRPIAAQTPTGSDVMIAQEEQAAVCAALVRLPDVYRDVIEWRNRDRLSFEEIGKKLDRSADASRLLWYRALNRLELEMRREPV